MQYYRCGGSAKRTLIDDKIAIINHCNLDISKGGKEHNPISFNDFYKLYLENKINKNYITDKKVERYLIRSIIKYESTNNEKIREIFYNICEKNESITNNKINIKRKNPNNIYIVY